MMTLRKSCIATESALLLAGLVFACAAQASGAAGTVTQLSGPLLVQAQDGRAKIVASGSRLEVGDKLMTGGDAYAEIRFIDGSAVILQPDTQLAIDAFSYDESRPGADRATLRIAEGGLRMTSGAIAARSPGRHTLVAPPGTIAVSRSTFIVSYAPPSHVASNTRIHLASLSTGTLSDAPAPPLVIAQASTSPGGGLQPGLYVQVIDGLIHLTNNGGAQSFAAGQFGYTANFTQPPVVLPNNPGLQFTPPPSFSSTGSTNSASASNKSAAVDCEVR